MKKEEKSKLVKKEIRDIFKKYEIDQYILYFDLDDDYAGSMGQATPPFIVSTLNHLLMTADNPEVMSFSQN